MAFEVHSWPYVQGFVAELSMGPPPVAVGHHSGRPLGYSGPENSGRSLGRKGCKNNTTSHKSIIAVRGYKIVLEMEDEGVCSDGLTLSA